MSNKKLDIEDLYRSHLGEFTAEPSAGLWTKIRYKLWWNEFLRFSLNTFNVYYLTTAVLITAGGILLFTNINRSKEEIRKSSDDSAILENQIPLNKNQVYEESGANSQNLSSESEKQKGTDTKTNADLQQDKLTGTEKQEKDASLTSDSKSQADAESTNLKETGQEGTKTGKLFVTAGFTISRQSGCSPLAVSFFNDSENGEKFLWTFGDGGTSEEENPSYIFDEPGEYNVNLKVTGADGEDYLANASIKVFITPKAQFEIEKNQTTSDGQPVYFYNYSKEADYYEWDFGDQSHSRLEEPVHYYEAPGKYDVKLIVWTENQCYDSVIVYNAFSPSEDQIIFPNAFTPNMNGPTGGSYNLNDPDNKVFHPVITGEISEYQLRIFNRLGYQIFETSDINTGWDGYCEDKLAGQGVYIWKARGKFSNGKSFVRSGDVTLIWVR